MPGKLDSVMVPLAEKLVGDFGKTVTYNVVTNTFDPSSGKTVASSVPNTVIITPPDPYNESRIDGTTIQVGDIMTSIAAAPISFVPSAGDKLTIDGQNWQVVGVKPVYSGSSVALYELQLRQ